jgi:hypothetical protein
MSSQQEGGAAGREVAPEGKDSAGTGPSGAAAEGKGAGADDHGSRHARESDHHTQYCIDHNVQLPPRHALTTFSPGRETRKLSRNGFKKAMHISPVKTKL